MAAGFHEVGFSGVISFRLENWRKDNSPSRGSSQDSVWNAHFPHLQEPEEGLMVRNEIHTRIARNIGRRSASKVGKPNSFQRVRASLLGWQLPHGAVDDLLDHHPVLNFKEKSAIFRQGAPADVLYWVRAGLVDLISPDAKKDILVEVAGPGELLGFMDIDENGGDRRQIFAAHARTRCEIGVISRERVASVWDKLPPEVLLTLADHINDWWSEKMERWARFVRLSGRERLETVLAELGEKCGVEDARGKLIAPTFSHADFASMIASSRPMVSRLLSEMVVEGHILRRDRHYLLCHSVQGSNRASMA
jgi:CRP-like cAMP-binding protein